MIVHIEKSPPQIIMNIGGPPSGGSAVVGAAISEALTEHKMREVRRGMR